VGHSRIGRFIYVALMMELFPQLIPYVLAVLEAFQRSRGIIWHAMAPFQNFPFWIA
jgi:hypothetical protein